ncbi:MAG: hypothetical protein IJV39_04935 [Ruminococcus sp.]|nr:hypothetical protein [Ruminococcus sp.]
MSEQTLNLLIENAANSVEMEGYKIDDQSKIWCKQLINKEITMKEYIELIKKKAGVA